MFKRALNASGIHIPVIVCVAGCQQQYLFENQHWLSNFWGSAIEVMGQSGTIALLRVTHDRLTDQTPTLSRPMEPEHQPILRNSQTVRNALEAKYVAGIGAVGVAGAVTGAGIGATIGAVGIGIVSFGVAAGAGLVIGGLIGGAVGALAAGGTLAAVKRYRNRSTEN